MEKWIPRASLTENDAQLIRYYARMFNIDPVTCYLLYVRGHRTQDTIRRFLYPSFNSFSNPFLLRDMEAGIERVSTALNRDETMGIFGDYDADGITSTSMLSKALHTCGNTPISLLPTRSEGYGLSKDAIRRFHEQGVTLLLTVDNGSSCHEEIAFANKLGIDVVVTDHHDILAGHPPACAFINPKRSDDTSGLSYLAGAGVTFFFIRALFEKRFLPWDVYMHEYVELACLGTICDMVPLIGDNRTLCDLGLKKMNARPSVPFLSLKRLLRLEHFDSNAVSFDIGPLVNAFGRYDNPNLLIPYFSADRWDEWVTKKCESLQTKRKKIAREQSLLAEMLIDEQGLAEHDILHLHGTFHEGILGVIASKFAKKYKKPTLVSCLNGKGSARSIPNSTYSIVELLQQHAPSFSKFGGHQFAAGFTIQEGCLDSLQSSLTNIKLPTDLLTQTAEYDMDVPIGQLADTVWRELPFLEPFGTGNPRPVFRADRVRFPQTSCFGNGDTHIKCLSGRDTFLSFFATNERIGELTFHDVDILYSPLRHHEHTIESVRLNPVSRIEPWDIHFETV